ncbi:plasminogen receptor (KT) isoform X1 [Apteryx mantelli]|uniref:Plasminogen receptor (KT) isoform X1 n=1 Tax=Apteryx mantelli TaxID=2696672 RepID=A0ABM4G4Z9_9AVES
MGFVFSKQMGESLKAQQEFMLMNSRLQLERQLLMQNQMRERQAAMQIAWTRELLKYFGTFFGLAASDKKEEPRSSTANSSLKLYICLSIRYGLWDNVAKDKRAHQLEMTEKEKNLSILVDHRMSIIQYCDEVTKETSEVWGHQVKQRTY